jgi:hypothetical protein
MFAWARLAILADGASRWGPFASLTLGLLALGLLAFWGGVLLAAWLYPSEYDWKYMTLTSLISAGRDPAGHLWASGGIVLCSLCWLAWIRLQARHWRRARPIGIWALQLGTLFMAGSAALPQSLLRVRKGHEILVALAFACLCLGMVQLLFRAVEAALQGRLRGSVRRQRRYAAIAGGIAVLPVLCAGAAQAYVYYALPALHWVSLGWRAQGVPAFLSFAFWEWITCAALSASVAIVTLAQAIDPASGRARRAAPGWATRHRPGPFED